MGSGSALSMALGQSLIHFVGQGAKPASLILVGAANIVQAGQWTFSTVKAALDALPTAMSTYKVQVPRVPTNSSTEERWQI